MFYGRGAAPSIARLEGMSVRNLRFSVRGVTALVMFVVVAGAGLLAVPPALAQELQVSTQPSPLYPSFDPSISDYVTRCTLGTPTQVSVSPPAGAEVDVDGHGYRTGDFTTDVNLQEGQGFTITVRSGSTAKYYVRCLPADFPAWTFQRSGQPQAQWYAVAPFAKTNFGPLPPGVSNLYGALFDQNGVPVWWYKTSQQTLDLKLLPNGDFAYAFFNASGIEERRLDGSLVRTLHAGGDAENTDPHEVLLLGDGNYLVLSNGPCSTRPSATRVPHRCPTTASRCCRPAGRCCSRGGRSTTYLCPRYRAPGAATSSVSPKVASSTRTTSTRSSPMETTSCCRSGI